MGWRGGGRDLAIGPNTKPGLKEIEPRYILEGQRIEVQSTEC